MTFHSYTMPRTKNSESKVESVSGRLQITFTNTSGTSSGTYVSPNFGAFAGTQTIAGGAKLSTLASIFQYYRFTKLRWRLLPSNTNAIEISGYAPDATTSVPNYSGVAGLPHTSDAISINASGVQSPSVPEKTSVPRKMLLDQNLRWWRTEPITSEDVNFINQGSLWVGSSVAFSNQIISIDLEYTCEFKDFIAATDLPLRVVQSTDDASDNGVLVSAPVRVRGVPTPLDTDEEKEIDAFSVYSSSRTAGVRLPRPARAGHAIRTQNKNE